MAAGISTSRFPAPSPPEQDFFPIGVWFESVLQSSDVDQDRAAGINMYVQLTEDSDLSLIQAQRPSCASVLHVPVRLGISASPTRSTCGRAAGSNIWTGNGRARE